MAVNPCMCCTPSSAGTEIVAQCVDCGSATVAGLGLNVTTMILAAGFCIAAFAYRRLFAGRLIKLRRGGPRDVLLSN